MKDDTEITMENTAESEQKPIRKLSLKQKKDQFIKWMKDKVPGILLCTDTTHSKVDIGVYFIIRNFTVIYVGQSKEYLKRIASQDHKAKKKDIVFLLGANPDDLDRLEKKYIKAFHPYWNDNHKDPDGAATRLRFEYENDKWEDNENEDNIPSEYDAPEIIIMYKKMKTYDEMMPNLIRQLIALSQSQGKIENAIRLIEKLKECTTITMDCAKAISNARKGR